MPGWIDLPAGPFEGERSSPRSWALEEAARGEHSSGGLACLAGPDVEPGFVWPEPALLSVNRVWGDAARPAGERPALSGTSPERLIGQTPPASEMIFFHTDHLGTPVVVTNGSGRKLSEHKYLPFGEEMAPAGKDTSRRRFTGHERDRETGLDYMLARYYSAPLGRFLSVDPAAATTAEPNPQKWNRYTYALNTPINAIDPDGQATILLSSQQGMLDDNAQFRGAIAEKLNAIPFVGDTVAAVVDGLLAGILPSTPEEYAGAFQGAAMGVGMAVIGAEGEAASAGGGAEAGARGSKPYEPTPQNVERMGNGKAPVGRDGHPVELHHEGQSPTGSLKEMTKSQFTILEHHAALLSDGFEPGYGSADLK